MTGARRPSTEAIDSAPAERLRRARRAKYRSAAAFAAAIGVPQSTYQLHESGQRTLTMEAAKRYAAGLGVSYVWLLHGVSGEPGDDIDREQDIPHILLNTPGDDELGKIVDTSKLPTQLIDWVYGVPEAQLRVVQADSDDMEPTLKRGDRVLVNVGVTAVTSAGIYLIKGDAGYSFRRVEPLPDSVPPQARLSCDNTRYQPHTVRLDKIGVRGRAMGLLRFQNF
jgi:phage repressor protein C with HTH and peptisase S24 domain